MRIGQSVELEIIRNGQEALIKAVIQQMEVVTVDGSEFSYRLAGAKIGEIRETDIRRGQVQYLQVVEIEPGSPGWNTGLRQDDIIHSINKVVVKTFEDAYAAANRSRALLLNIRRGNQALYVLLK